MCQAFLTPYGKPYVFSGVDGVGAGVGGRKGGRVNYGWYIK